MTRFPRRLHYRPRGRKLHPLAIVGICLGGAILLAIIIGNILNARLDDVPTPPSEETETPTDANTPQSLRTAPRLQAYPFALGDDPTDLITEGDRLLQGVTVSINTPEGDVLYTSPVVDYQRLNAITQVDMRDAMSDLTMEIPYVCGIFYPQASDTTDTDLLYAAVSADASLLLEFLHAGGSEILLAGASLEAEDLPYLADYVTMLRERLKGTPVGLAIPLEFAMGEDSWQLLPALRQLVDYLAIDLQSISDETMEGALLNANYYTKQYEMSLVLSASQTVWISAAETVYDDFRILPTRPQKIEGQG